MSLVLPDWPTGYTPSTEEWSALFRALEGAMNIALQLRGTWDATKSYDLNDCVFFNDALYLARQNVAVGVQPGSGSEDDWYLCAGSDNGSQTSVDWADVANKPDASATVKGVVKLKTAPASAANPLAVGDNDPRLTPFGPSGTNHRAGLVPDPGVSAGIVRYLREDSTWQVPPDNVGSGGGYAPDTVTVQTQTVSGTDVTAGTYDSTNATSTHNAPDAFDGDTSTYWQGGSGDALKVQRASGGSAAINGLKIRFGNASFSLIQQLPTRIVVKGASSTGGTFPSVSTATTLLDQSGITWSGTERSFSWDNTTAYDVFFLQCFAPSGGGSTVVIPEAQFFAGATSSNTDVTVNDFVGLLTPPACTTSSAPLGTVFFNVANGHLCVKRLNGTVVDLTP